MALFRQGVQYEDQHNPAKAADALERAAKLGETALGATSPVLADIYNALGHTDFGLGRYSSAVAGLQRTLAIRQASLPPTDPKLANSINDLAFVDAQIGRYDEAATLYKQAASIQEKLRGADHPETVRVLNNLAVLYLYQGRYADAEPLLKRVTVSWEKSLGPAHPDVLTSLNNLAGLYDRQGRYAEAEPLIKRLLEIREKTRGPDHPDVAQSLNNLALLYSEEGRYADAEPLIKRALQIEEKARGADHPEVVTELSILASDYMKEGRYADAEPLFRRALAIREKAFGPANTNVAQILNNLAVLYMEQDRYADAEPLLTRAIDIKQKALGPDHPELGADLHNLGFIDTAQGRYAEAEPLLTRALAIQERALGPDHPDVAGTLNALAALDDAEGRRDDALAASRRAVAILVKRAEHAGGDRTGTNERERRTDRGYFLRLMHLLASGLAGANQPGNDTIDEAFRAGQYAGGIETAKAVSGMMARYASGTDDLAALVREREDLSNRWNKLDSDLLKAAALTPDKRNPVSEAAARKEQGDIAARLAADNDRLHVGFPRFAELAEARPVHVADVQSVLRPAEAFVAFTLADKESFLFVIRKQDAHFFKLAATGSEVAAIVKSLRAGLANDAPVDVAKAHELYRTLLGPADALIADAKNLVVSPDGALQSLPFAVLVTKSPAAITKFSDYKPSDYQAVDWLVRRQAISVVPAASSLVALRRFAQAKHGTDPFAGFGDPIFDGSGEKRGIDMASLYRGAEASSADLRRLPRLPETADELRAEAKILGAADTSLHLGPDASIATLRRLDLANTRVISFATHGLIAGDLPTLGEPALVLTPPAHPTPDDDGLLRASAVSQLRLDADFVILSACNTAASDGTPGAEGLSGLAKAFFYAGARSLLVSHWPVDSQAPVKLTTGMIGAVAQDPAIGRAEALRRAMLAMIDDTTNGSERAHPFFWAPFILAGEGGASR
ncbi:tetratricopeptide repeat protein [Bradyrhizobium sp.]|uniref:tetratricopeptide repeat protein n=1 Tax=Bradyrhizobium sp. TaxID=376 RepID=UPI003C3AF686